MPCTHVHTDDLRGPVALTQALNGHWQADGIRVPIVPRTELRTAPHDGPGIRYRDAMAVLDAALPAGVDIVVDAGNIGASAIHYLPARRDGGLSSHSAWAVWATASAPASVWRSVVRRRTVVIAGDGSFFMHGMEIHTAVQYRLPVTFLLFDNHAHAMCVTREQLFYDDLLQLQPVRAQPAGRRPGRNVPRPAVRRRRRRSTIYPQRCGRRSRSTGRR